MASKLRSRSGPSSPKAGAHHDFPPVFGQGKNLALTWDQGTLKGIMSSSMNLGKVEIWETSLDRIVTLEGRQGRLAPPPSPRGGPALWETLKVATFAIPQSHSVDCKAERVRPGRCGNDTPIVPSASWRRSKTVTRNGRRTSPRRRGTSRLTAGTSGVRCCASKTPVGISRLYLCAARRHTPEL